MWCAQHLRTHIYLEFLTCLIVTIFTHIRSMFLLVEKADVLLATKSDGSGAFGVSSVAVFDCAKEEIIGSLY